MNDETSYERKIEDVGNIVKLEHVNLGVPDQSLATIFYVSGLGLTRDPYLMTGVDNMWINVGGSQFHLPTRRPQKLRGHVGLVVPDRESLLARLCAVRESLADSQFDVDEHESYVDGVCPWGNRIRCYEPDSARFGPITLGMPYVEFDVPSDSARAIADFYREIFATPAGVSRVDGKVTATVAIGSNQQLRFRESGAASAAYDGHHIQLYVADFSRPYDRLREHGLITEESDQHQYRFLHITDIRDGTVKFAVEHEIRSTRHPLFARPLVNRDPTQSNRSYRPGHDSLIWSGLERD
jgi:catechol 2,3-dioxygenase-like lactoylglutathione lyase family enzyme